MDDLDLRNEQSPVATLSEYLADLRAYAFVARVSNRWLQSRKGGQLADRSVRAGEPTKSLVRELVLEWIIIAFGPNRTLAAVLRATPEDVRGLANLPPGFAPTVRGIQLAVRFWSLFLGVFTLVSVCLTILLVDSATWTTPSDLGPTVLVWLIAAVSAWRFGSGLAKLRNLTRIKLGDRFTRRTSKLEPKVPDFMLATFPIPRAPQILQGGPLKVPAPCPDCHGTGDLVRIGRVKEWVGPNVDRGERGGHWVPTSREAATVSSCPACNGSGATADLRSTRSFTEYSSEQVSYNQLLDFLEEGRKPALEPVYQMMQSEIEALNLKIEDWNSKFSL